MKQVAPIPKRYMPIWEQAAPLLASGRSEDHQHAQDTVEMILGYEGDIAIDESILIPVAIMHDIGHSAILPEHYRHITGPEKLINGKLVHMLAGAKIARDILNAVGYDKTKSEEIVDIISVHDADALKDVDLEVFYDTENKKIFHDFDRMDAFTEKRLEKIRARYPDLSVLKASLERSLGTFFFDEFRLVAEERFQKLFQ